MHTMSEYGSVNADTAVSLLVRRGVAAPTVCPVPRIRRTAPSPSRAFFAVRRAGARAPYVPGVPMPLG